MQKKQLVYLVIAVVIVIVAGYLTITQLLPKSGGAKPATMVEVIGSIKSDLGTADLNKLVSEKKLVDYATGFDYYANLGNKSLFGQ